MAPKTNISIRLGSFTLTRILGSGGMGEVWEGTHRALGLPVAVKVVRGPHRDSPEYQRAFRNEVRAVAALDHPNVVRVVDADRITEEAAESSGHLLEAGAPYFVMERLQSDLRSHTQPEDWRFLREVARDLLKGLAHAHARGILHRDVKPANVLLDARSRAKLTDFGLAQLQNMVEDEPQTAGTPTYMSPEQLFGRWRDAGPWSDLYATGTVLWELASGAPPFGVLQAREAVRAHAVLELPSLVPRFDVPSGFESWLRRMLCKETTDRFQRAADALWALEEVDRVRAWVPAGTISRPMSPDEQPTDLTGFTGITKRQGGTEVLDDSDISMVEVRGGSMHVSAVLPMTARPPPISTSPPEAATPSQPLLGAGLGLVAQRPPPLVGRREEQEQLWSQLVAVHKHRHAQCAWLRGPVGFGKTRLADWLLEASHAEGASHRFRTEHAAEGHRRAGLLTLLARELDAEGLIGRALRTHIHERVAFSGNVDDETAILNALDDSSTGSLPPRALYSLIERVLARRLVDRPGVLLLDDVAFSPDSLGFVRYLVRGPGRRLPLLVIVTTDDELLAERPAARAALEDLMTGPRMVQMEIGPLERVARRELVRGLLGVDSPLVDRVESQTNGHPLFAVELVRSWVEEGSITAVDGSYRLAREARRGLPPDLARVWRSRLGWALRDRPEEEAIALEVAAVLGDEVRLVDWTAACQAAGIQVSPELVDLLVDVGLAERNDGTVWRFAHRMLRQAILDRCARHGRTATLHAAAAMALAEGGPSVAGRRGSHLLAAGHQSEAVTPLIEGLGYAIRIGDADAELLLEACKDAMAQSSVPTSDPRRGQLLTHEESLAQFRLDGHSIERIAHEMLTQAERNGWPDLAIRGTLALAGAYRLLGRHRDALPLLEAGRAMCRADNVPNVLIRILHTLATVNRELGRIDAAEAAVREAIDLATSEHLTEFQGALQVSLVAILLNRGALDEASDRIEAAITRIGPEQGSLLGEALMLRGEVQRRRGNLTEALASYRRSRTQFLQLGHDGQALFPALNGALVLVLENRFVEAEAEAREALRGFKERDASLGQVFAHAVILPCVAATGRWGAFDRCLERIVERVRADGLADDDVASLLVRAGRFARQAGRAVQGRAALEAAKDQYRRLGRHEEADLVR